MANKPGLHGLIALPEGKKIGEVVDVFSAVRNEFFAGDPNPDCASCRKPFNALRKRRKSIRLYPVKSLVPVAFSLDICGHCLALVQQGGDSKEGVLASVEAYFYGAAAQQ